MGHFNNFYYSTVRTASLSNFFKTQFKGKYLKGNDSQIIFRARKIAKEIVKFIPKDLECILPRGYCVKNSQLILCKSQYGFIQGVVYKCHSQWDNREAAIFLSDIEEGWISELILYLKWHYRHDDAVFLKLQDKISDLGSILSKT